MYIGHFQQSQFQSRQTMSFRNAGHDGPHRQQADNGQGRHPGRTTAESVVYSRSASWQSSSVTHSKPAAQAAAVGNVQETAKGALQAAGTILKFIEARLLQDVADGATAEKLQSRLQAGLEGFEKGFRQAQELLSGLEGMTGEIQAEIDQTHDLVLQGIESLRQHFVDASAAEGAPSSGAEEASPVPVQPERQTSTAASSLLAREEQGGKNSFSFQLTTVDGDHVQIHASSLRASILQARLSTAGGFDVNSSGIARDDFSLFIDGELDSGELVAIHELLSAIGDLSEQFFGGDVERAFNMAMELGYDSAEISGFALRLQHTSVQRMNQAYESFNDRPGSNAPLVESLRPLGHYVAKLLEAYDHASAFQQPLQLLQELAGNFSVAESSSFRASMKLAVWD